MLDVVESQMLPHLDGLDALWGWQRQAVATGFSQRSTSTTAQLAWRYRTIIVELCRQNGKTTLAALIAAIWMSLGGTVLYTAHARVIARPRWLECARMLERSGFGKLYRGSGSEHVQGTHGGSFWLVTPDDAGGRSHSAHCVIADESAHIGPEFFASVLATMATIPNAQLWMLSSAGWLDAELGSTMLAQSEEAVAQIPMLPDERDTALLSYGAAADDDPADPDTWARSIPTLGEPGGVDVAFVRHAQRTMDPVDFAREFLTIWTPGAADTAIEASLWARAAVGLHIVNPVPFQTLGVDIAPDQSYAAVVAAWGGHPECQARLLRAGKGTDWLEGLILDYQRTWGIERVVIDYLSPAEGLITELERKGVATERIGASGVAASCSRLVGKMQADPCRLAVERDDILTASVLDAKRREIADTGWAIKRRTKGPPAMPAVALAFAVWGWDEGGRGQSSVVVVE